MTSKMYPCLWFDGQAKAASYLLGFVLGLFYALAVSVALLCGGAAAAMFYFKKRK